MRAMERLSCAVGNIFNDLLRQLLLSFEIVFFMKVVELSAAEAGLIILVGQITDAFSSPITGYLGDRVNVPFLSKKIGGRKSCHLLATVFMAIGLSLLFNRCFLCDGRHQSWLPLVYFCFCSALVNICYNVVEINHLTFITTVAESVEEFTVLSAMRTVFSFLSGVYIYFIAWGLLGQDSGDTLGPNSFSDLAYLSWITTGTGVFFAAIFYIGTKEPEKRLRKESTYSDIMNAPGIFMTVFGPEGVDSKNNSLAYTFVDMIMASSNSEKNEHEIDSNEETQSHALRARKRSILQKFVAAIFYDDENNSGHNQSQSNTEEKAKNTESEDTKTRMVSEVQHLNRDRKKSLLVRVFNALLFRIQNYEQELPIVSTEDQLAVDIGDDQNITGESYCRQKVFENVPNEDIWKTHNIPIEGNHENEETVTDKEDHTGHIPETSVWKQRRQRKHGVVVIPNGGNHGLPNLGCEHDKNDDTESGNRSNTSVREPKKSVTFSAPEFPEMASMTRRRELNLDDLSGKDTNLDDSPQNYLTQHFTEDKRIESYQVSNNSSALEDNPHALGLPVSSAICPSEKKRPKRIKDWLRDPNLYKVAIIFTCSRLAQDAIYGYIPLFLTERLLFPKEAIAYFPLILLISASFASSICNKLNRKIGSKWSYLLGGFLVMAGAVWSYFQTTSTRQSTYAPLVIIGSGSSIMYVMALVFIIDLIGENKETSGSVFAVITVIARLSAGGLVIGIQKFYPEEGTSSNEAISNYVRHVFAMAPAIITLVALLLVLFFQPSKFSSKTKVPQDVKAQDGQSSFDDRVPNCPSENKTTPNVNLDGNQNVVMATVHPCSEDTKL